MRTFLVLVTFCFCQPCFALYSGGDGLTADTAYQISSTFDLQYLAGNIAVDRDKFFILTCDLDFSKTGFVIGNSQNPFTGSFDGQGRTIYNLTISPASDYAGLFGYNNGNIRNLTLQDVSVLPTSPLRQCVGAIAGLNSGIIENCTVIGNINGGNICGSVAGKNLGTISNCIAFTTITGGNNTGGICGINTGGTLMKCSANINLLGANYSGGLIGQCSSGRVEKCSAKGVGDSPQIKGAQYTGGLVGTCAETSVIQYSYACASVKGTDSVGGLIGRTPQSSPCPQIFNCYSASSVSGTNNVKGVVGSFSSGTFSACFWDSSIGGSNAGVGNVTPLSSHEMKIAQSFIGWDFVGERGNGTENIWRMSCDPEEPNYPELSFMFSDTDLACPDGVDLIDYAELARAWLLHKDPDNLYWYDAYDISEPKNDIIDEMDLAVFARDWLEP